MIVNNTGSSSNFPNNVPTPQQTQAGQNLQNISQILEDISNDLNNPSFTPAQKLAALTKDLGYLKQFETALEAIPPTSLSSYDQQMLKNLEPQIQDILWLSPQQLLDNFSQNSAYWSNSLGFTAGEAYMLSQSLLTGT